jgi:superfamily II DNA or RNA helicase
LTAKFKWALTGTPLENHLGDVLTIFDFLHPGYLPINQSKELTEEFVKNNIAIFMLRRLKRDVMKDLPPKIRQDIFLSLNPAQSRAYNKVLEDQKKGFIEKGQKITKVDILSAIQVLKQICNFPPHQQENSQTNSPKMLALREIIDEIEKGESKLLVFSQYTRNYGIAEIERLLNQPDKVCKLIGGMSESERTKVIDRFKNDSSTKVMLISVKAGGTGLTLIEASYVVHFDQWWNPAVSRQAEDRAHRKGQKAKAVNIYEFWMINTIEERIHRLIKDKGLLADRVIDSLASPEELATKISITDLLGVYDLHQESTGAIVEKLEVRPEDSEHDPMKIPAQTLTLSEIQQRISELTPDKFEILIAELMKKLGFENVTRTGKSGDGGIDVIGYAISESGPSYTLVQCKHYSRQKVGVGAIRDFYGAVTAYSNDADGIMMSSGDLSQQAIDFAKTQTQGRVGVFQGLRLINMIKQFNMYI